MNKPKVSVVTPIHNGIEETLKFLDSLDKINYPNFDVIIIDDGSKDHSSEIIARKFPRAIRLKGDGNLWWSGATNLGVKYALGNKSDYILTINNDVEVDPNFLTALVECAEGNPESLVGSIIYDSKSQELWYSGGKINWNNGTFPHNLEPIDYIYQSEWLTGMGVLIKSEVFEKIGLYNNDKFPQYAGDLEFSMRAKKNGYNLIICSKSIIYNNTDSCNDILHNKEMTVTLFLKSLFSIRSNCNLKLRYYLYKYYSPTPIRNFLIFYVNHIINSIYHIIKKRACTIK